MYGAIFFITYFLYRPGQNVASDNRVTDSGDLRITDNSDTRITD